MSSTLATILVNLDVTGGTGAVDYTAPNGICPVLGFHCVGSSGSGDVKLTAYSATKLSLGATAGSGGRLRIKTDGTGSITSVEIACGGTGYPDGPVPVILEDPYGTGGSIVCTASGGAISSAAVTSPGSGYSGYILFDVNDFIEGVTYNIVPRYIEQTGSTALGTLRLVGYKLPYRPFQQF